MNLSFSTNRWSGRDMNEFIDIDADYYFGGIEIHNVNDVENAFDVYHKLIESSKKISCIDMVTDVSEDVNAAIEEMKSCTEVSKILRNKYIRVKASKSAEEFLEKALEYAEENGMILLVETVGEYADTEKLAEL